MHLTLVSTSTDCYSGLEDKTCQKNTNSNSIFYNKSCMAIDAVCLHFGYFNGGNTTHCFGNSSEAKAFGDIYNRTLSSEEYFRYDISCHQRCIVSGGSGNEPYVAVQRWGTRQNLFKIALAKRVIVDCVQRLRSWYTWCHMGKLWWHTMGIVRIPHFSLASVLPVSSTWHPDHRQDCLLYRPFSLRYSHSSANTR